MDETAIKRAVDEIANALQTAVLVAARLRVRLNEDADDGKVLEGALRRATATLQRLQPR